MDIYSVNKNYYKGAIFERIDISDYLMRFLNKVSRNETYKTNVKTEFDAYRIKELLNSPESMPDRSMKNIQTGEPYWSQQGVDYIASNLGFGKGHIFYFLCNNCKKRVKYLYFYSQTDSPLCRKCCNLPYRQSSRLERLVFQRIRKHPEMVRSILNLFE